MFRALLLPSMSLNGDRPVRAGRGVRPGRLLQLCRDAALRFINVDIGIWRCTCLPCGADCAGNADVHRDPVSVRFWSFCDARFLRLRELPINR